jgi:hypothetical protein
MKYLVVMLLLAFVSGIAFIAIGLDAPEAKVETMTIPLGGKVS